MKKLQKISIGFLVLFLMFIKVNAISGNLSISNSNIVLDNNQAVGKTIPITVNYRLNESGVVQIKVTSSNSNILQIVGNGRTAATSFANSGSLQVSAIIHGTGSVVLTATTTKVESKNGDIGSNMTTTKTITVKNKPVATPTQPKPTPPRQTGDSVAPPNQVLRPTVNEKSNNNFLSSLEVENGQLSPKLDIDVTTYSVTLPKATTKAVIKATAENSKATINGLATIDVKEGNNTHEIVVKAEDGSERKYLLNIFVEETAKTTVENYGILNHLPATLPESYKLSEKISINNVEVQTLSNGKNTLVYTVDSSGNKKWQYYNNNRLSNFEIFEYNNSQFVLAPIDFDKKIVGMQLKEAIVFDKTIKAYVFDDAELSQYVLMPMIENNETQYYMYDTKSKTLQKHIDTAKVYEKTMNELTENNKMQKLVIYGLIVASGLATVATITLLIILIRRKKHAR